MASSLASPYASSVNVTELDAAHAVSQVPQFAHITLEFVDKACHERHDTPEDRPFQDAANTIATLEEFLQALHPKTLREHLAAFLLPRSLFRRP